MRTSAAGRALIMRREGFRLRAYRDTRGILTIGCGHTSHAGPPTVSVGMVVTRAKVIEILGADLAAMERAVTALLKRPLNQGCFDAVMSLVFNIGVTGFSKSTVLRRINAGNLRGAADGFLLWDHPAELTARRRAERQQFIKAIATVAKPVVAKKPAPPLPPALPPRTPAASPAPTRPPAPALPPQAQTSPAAMTNKTPFIVALLLALFGASAAHAGDVDFAPVANAAVAYLLVPLLGAALTWFIGILGVGLKRVMARYPALMDQQQADLFAKNVDGVLQKAISFGAAQAGQLIGRSDLHANVDGWVATYAAQYAVAHAPDLMAQAGDITQKIVARLADHPAVQDLKAKVEAAPIDLHPVAAAA